MIHCSKVKRMHRVFLQFVYVWLLFIRRENICNVDDSNGVQRYSSEIIFRDLEFKLFRDMSRARHQRIINYLLTCLD